MENNCIDTLEYLLKIKSENKKKAPSQIERDQFCTNWMKLAVSEGYSERAERYLYNGVSYCGAKPFKEYIDQLENREQGLLSFFAGKMYGTNADTTFRLLVHLFALFLNDKNSVDLLADIIVRFPQACLNKDKKRLHSIESSLLKYFFAELNPNVCLVPLAEIGIKSPVFIDEFISVMESALEKIDPNGQSKKKKANIAKVNQWIDEYRQSGTDVKQPETAPTAEKVHEDLAPKPAEDVAPAISEPTEPVVEAQSPVMEKKAAMQEDAANVVPSAGGEHPSDLATRLMDLLSEAGRTATAVKAESMQQKIKIDVLSQELENEQKKLHYAEQQLAEQQAIISELRKKLVSSEDNISMLRQTIEQKDTAIAQKEEEIAGRMEMAEVLDRDRSKQADEALQRLASKIRVEYRDFMDALDVPMSCDLGENLRLQLQTIFDILEKGGMKIK